MFACLPHYNRLRWCFMGLYGTVCWSKYVFLSLSDFIYMEISKYYLTFNG